MGSNIEIWIAAINAVIMIWLGWRQYMLQKQQTEFQRRQTAAQEYEIYRSIYLLIMQTHDEIDDFIHDVSMGTWGSVYNVDKELLKRKERRVNQLKKELIDNYVDYDLKFSKTLFDKEAYIKILSTMSAVLYHMNLEIENNEVEMPFGSQHIPSIDGDVEMGVAVAISKRFKDREMTFEGLMNFIEQKRKLGSCEDALKVIKEKCKID